MPASARRPAPPPTRAERAAGAPCRSAAASRVQRAEGAGQRKSDDGEQQATNLGRARSAEHHHPIPVSAQSGQERRDAGEVEGLRQSSLLADQPATPAGRAGAEMAEHPAHGQPQSLATPDHFGDMYGLSQICGACRSCPPAGGFSTSVGSQAACPALIHAHGRGSHRQPRRRLHWFAGDDSCLVGVTRPLRGMCARTVMSHGGAS